MKFPHKATKKGNVWIHDFHDVLADFLDDWSEDRVGTAYHPIGNSNKNGYPCQFIVLEHRRIHRPRYVGQFYVAEKKLKNKAWKYRGKKYGFCIYQAADDKGK